MLEKEIDYRLRRYDELGYYNQTSWMQTQIEHQVASEWVTLKMVDGMLILPQLA